MSFFDAFTRKHDYLVCVDSDGCVMDTMNCKHFHCFGPCMVTEWGLEEWKEEILDRWNVINLFSMTRGINRFKGLAMALGEIDKLYKPITGIAALQHWVEVAPALSNDGVAKAAAEATDPDAKLVFQKALSWSKAVNAAIVELDEALKIPYEGAKEGLAAAHAFADVAMVSSANRDVVEEEWGKFGLLEHTDIVLAQDVGCGYHMCHLSTKESLELIRQAKKQGLDVTCETGPHYLVMDDRDLQEHGRFKMNPPIRSEADRLALLEGVIDGTIDMIATDHAPHSAEEKSKGLEKSAFGVVGLETAFPVMYTHFVKTGIITLERLIELMSTNPARIIGLDNSNSFACFDLDACYKIDPANFLSMGQAMPFEGWEVYGKCVKTIVNGITVYNNTNQ